MILSICPNCKQKRRIVTSTSSEGSSLFLVSLLILHLFSTSFTSKHPKPPQNRAPHNLQPAEPKLGPAHGLCVVLRVPGADGWWLRLASGKKWVPETWNGREACVKCSPSASDALESLRHIRFARANSGVLERNARLVCAQIAKQSATAAK
ncbi:unnamed protein product [Durusdinium trenchii]|uniref:Uncharacterized protein n=1 Tax=Durusdinium trenchii TaxID=1381693 RepID=A0ABP0RUN0_9DINO